MIEWKNLNELASFDAAAACPKVDLKAAMTGEEGAERVRKMQAPMAAGLTYVYAAKAVDDGIVDALASFAKEAQLLEKYAALYNG